MNWLEMNARTAIARDRRFRVPLRPGPGANPVQIIDLVVEADELWQMAQHGPITCVLNSFVANQAKKFAWTSRFGWWGDPIVELH